MFPVACARTVLHLMPAPSLTARRIRHRASQHGIATGIRCGRGVHHLPPKEWLTPFQPWGP